jgi:hypothetical protein
MARIANARQPVTASVYFISMNIAIPNIVSFFVRWRGSAIRANRLLWHALQMRASV